MNFSEYQAEAKKTVIYSDNLKLTYPTLGLAGEAGEVCNKVKKVFRDKGGHLDEDGVSELSKEIGDILWYIAALTSDLELDLNTIAKENLEKLRGRQERNVLGGSGDNR